MIDIADSRRKARIVNRGLHVQSCLVSARKVIDYCVKNGVGCMDIPFPLLDLRTEVADIRFHFHNVRLFSKYSHRRMAEIIELIRNA